jgi:hypothetical protein
MTSIEFLLVSYRNSLWNDGNCQSSMCIFASLLFWVLSSGMGFSLAFNLRVMWAVAHQVFMADWTQRATTEKQQNSRDWRVNNVKDFKHEIFLKAK